MFAIDNEMSSDDESGERAFGEEQVLASAPPLSDFPRRMRSAEKKSPQVYDDVPANEDVEPAVADG